MLIAVMPKEKYSYYIVIESDTCPDGVVAAAYAAHIKLNLTGDAERGKVLIVDRGMTCEQKLSCLELCRESNEIHMVSRDEIKDFFR